MTGTVYICQLGICLKIQGHDMCICLVPIMAYLLDCHIQTDSTMASIEARVGDQKVRARDDRSSRIRLTYTLQAFPSGTTQL